jgi:prevent-host-death family protein
MTAQHEITQRDLRSKSGEIMDAVEHGEAFVVTRNGNPIGELIPLRRRRVVTREQFAAMSEHAAFVDPDRFRADLDAVADTSLQDPYA